MLGFPDSLEVRRSQAKKTVRIVASGRAMMQVMDVELLWMMSCRVRVDIRIERFRGGSLQERTIALDHNNGCRDFDGEGTAALLCKLATANNPSATEALTKAAWRRKTIDSYLWIYYCWYKVPTAYYIHRSATGSRWLRAVPSPVC